jgi:hypothetical protein
VQPISFNSAAQLLLKLKSLAHLSPLLIQSQKSSQVRSLRMRASLPRVLAMPISMWFSPLFSVARVNMFLEKIKVRKELHSKPWYLKSNMMPSRLDSSRMRPQRSAALNQLLTWRRQSPVVNSKSRTSRKTTLSSLKMQIEI